MPRIALVPMAAKPYHVGHDGLVRIAASECDEVRLFVSAGDRVRPGEIPIYGKDMLLIWANYIEPTLPGNVDVQYVAVPVQSVYANLEEAEAIGDTETVFVIYSDNEDILKYKPATLTKSASSLYTNDQIELRGVDRNETVPVSGTKMREYLAAGDAKNFAKFLPAGVRQYSQEIIGILNRNLQESTRTLKNYIKLILRS